jgi:peptide deformylase
VDGDPVSLTADGFHARVIQHEYDHLDGVVFLDRMTSPHSLAYEDEWERYVLQGGADDD